MGVGGVIWEKMLYFYNCKKRFIVNFVGEFTSKIDPKRRIVLPALFKKQLGNTPSSDLFILKEDLYEKCLVLYPMQEWERQNQIILEKLNPFNREHNQFLRIFSKGACEVTLDNVNRFLIPKRLLEYAGIEKDVVLSGQNSKIEIWAAESYQKIWDNPVDFGALADKIMNP